MWRRGVLMLPTRRLQSSRAQAMLVSEAVQAAGSWWGFAAAVRFYHSCGPWNGSLSCTLAGTTRHCPALASACTRAACTAGVVHISTIVTTVQGLCQMPADDLQALQHSATQNGVSLARVLLIRWL